MIKLIVFDLDGVLVESKETHFVSLNDALRLVDEKYVISKDDHLRNFDGLPTRRKLKKLTEERGLPESCYEMVWKNKQAFTVKYIRQTERDDRLCKLFQKLKSDGFKVYVGSNAILQTTKLYLIVLGLIEYVDGYVSNEDVVNPKPHPEMYIKIMAKEHASPKETLIVEDSHVGITAVVESGAHLLMVKNSQETTEKRVFDRITRINKVFKNIIKWRGDTMNILIPAAGAGSRFAKNGYTFPKPLIDVNGKPMIQVVVENLSIDGNYIYIVQKEHYDKYNLKYLLNMITPNCTIIIIDHITEGAACTTLLAKEYINNNQPLLLANSDQYVQWSSVEFMYAMGAGNTDGGILTFKSMHPKWSYAKLNEELNIIEIAEKKVISDIATVGIYYWSTGSDYVKYAEQMISKDIRVNNEFYVAPVYNEAIADGKKFKTFDVDKMWGLGTPEDLQQFLKENDTVLQQSML